MATKTLTKIEKAAAFLTGIGSLLQICPNNPSPSYNAATSRRRAARLRSEKFRQVAAGAEASVGTHAGVVLRNDKAARVRDLTRAAVNADGRVPAEVKQGGSESAQYVEVSRVSSRPLILPARASSGDRLIVVLSTKSAVGCEAASITRTPVVE